MDSIGFNLGINKRLMAKFRDNFFLDKRFIAGTLVPSVLDVVGFDKDYSHFYGCKFLRYPVFESLKTFTKEDIEFGTIDSLKDKNLKGIQLDSFLKYNNFINERDPYKLGIIMHLICDRAFDGLSNNIVSELSAFPIEIIEQYTYVKHDITAEEIDNIYGIIDSVFSVDLAKYLKNSIKLDCENKFTSRDLSNKKHINDLYKKIDNEYAGFQKKLIK